MTKDILRLSLKKKVQKYASMLHSATLAQIKPVIFQQQRNFTLCQFKIHSTLVESQT